MTTRMTTNSPSLFLLSSALLAACSAPADVDGEEGGAEFVTTEQDITRGALINPGDDPAAVKLQFATHSCSGTKIGAQRFLTAGHCVGNVNVPARVTITNADDGSGGSEFNITAVHRYPTAPANFASGHMTDVGMFDVQETSPGIGTFSAVRAPYVDTGLDGWLTGFGCDLANPSNGGKKQFAFLTSEFFGDPPSYAGYIYSSGNPKPAVCSGDSGGPLYYLRDGVWELGGVVAAGDNDNNSWLTRLGRVRFWIANPKLNRFVHGAKGSLLNHAGNNCIAGLSTLPLTGTSLNFCDLRDVPVDRAYWSLSAVLPGVFNIKNTLSGQCLLPANPNAVGTSVLQGSCSSSSARWRFTSPVSADGFQYFHIKNTAGIGMCIGTTGGSVDNGTASQMFPCTSGAADSQAYVFVP